jgi:prepilin-type N-terminal cleavage/methylation domain-containing protein
MKSIQTRRRLSENRGFTLLEILIVIAIVISVFGGLGVAGFKYAKQRGDIASVVRAMNTDKSALAIFTNQANSNGLIPLTKGTTATLPLTGTMAGSTAAVIGNAVNLEIALLGSGALEGASLITLGSNVAPGGTTTAPVLWNQTTQTFYTTGDVAPTYDYSATATLDCVISAPATAPSAAAGANFRLDGTTNLPANTRVVYRKIPNVTASAAYALAQALYKGTLPAQGSACDVGPIAYGAADASGKTTLYIFITQQ